MDIKTWAPVCITTCNRFNHFKQCLESLEKCTGAEYTEVYVALDYPPSEKYVEGWKKIDAFLSDKEASNAFLKLIVIRRETNCGLYKKGSNSALLVKQVLEKYDRYIITEDDNVFAPCFLEYMNKGLELFENDDSVYTICGYDFGADKSFLGEDTFYKTKRICSWGVGRWKSKRDYYVKHYAKLDDLREILDNPEKRAILKKNSPDRLGAIASMIESGKRYGDVVQQTYLYLEDKYNVFPSVSLVQNHGVDGSGEHGNGTSDQREFYANQDISVDKHFDFVGQGIVVDPKIADPGRSITWKVHISRMISRIKLLQYDIKKHFNRI